MRKHRYNSRGPTWQKGRRLHWVALPYWIPFTPCRYWKKWECFFLPLRLNLRLNLLLNSKERLISWKSKVGVICPPGWVTCLCTRVHSSGIASIGYTFVWQAGLSIYTLQWRVSMSSSTFSFTSTTTPSTHRHLLWIYIQLIARQDLIHRDILDQL